MSEKIIPTNLSEQFRKDYQRYAIYVTYKRIMADIRDGFKPVQRRIIYTMYNEGYATKKAKSATVSGAVMKLHPHADSYSSFKPLANWFESYIPMIKGQGNWGNVQGNVEAAARYTECRLSDFANEFIVGDLREANESVDWVPNYNNTMMEPEYLPSALPMLLINGAFGIGIGKKVEIPPHNTNEVIDAIIALIHNPNQKITLIPDTCMECEIFDDGRWDEISNLGYGFYTSRGMIHLEENYSNDHVKNRTALVITSLPHMIYLDQIIEQIDGLITKKKIIQIDGYYEESKDDDLRFVIVLKPGADPEYVKNVLYQNTSLQQTNRINFEMLNGLEIVRPSYTEYLKFFIQHRMMVKYRVFINRMRQVDTEMHRKDAFIKLLESGAIDKVIDMIKKYKKDDDAALVESVIKLIGVTDLQAKYIINTRLAGLSSASLSKLKEEKSKLQEMHDQYIELVTNESALMDYIERELLVIKERYGTPRKSHIIKKPSAKDSIPSGAMVVAITEKGYIKKIPIGGNFGMFRNDNVKFVVEIDNADNLVIFDSSGKVYKLPIYKLPFSDRMSNGVDIRFVIKSFNGVAVNAFPESTMAKLVKENNKKNKNGTFVVISLTKMGYIKSMDISEFLNITSAGLSYAKLDKDDYIQNVIIGNTNENLIIFDKKKAMRICIDKIPAMKRAARGNQTFKSHEVDGMIASGENMFEYMVVITEKGHMNKIPIKGIPGLQTTKKEFSVIRLQKDDSISNILFASNSHIIEVRCLNLGILEFKVKDIPIGSTISGGDKVISMKNDKLVYSILK